MSIIQKYSSSSSSKDQFISFENVNALFGETFRPIVSKVWNVVTEQSLHRTLFCSWSLNMEWRSEIALSLYSDLQQLVSPFPLPLGLFLEQYGANRYDRLLAVPDYQSWCQWVSGPSFKHLWNVVWSGLTDGVPMPIRLPWCLLVDGCHSFDFYEPAIEGKDAGSSCLLDSA